MDAGLEGRVALVTASSDGIGKAVALGLARGVRVAICGRDQRKLETAKAERAKILKTEPIAVEADVSGEVDIDRLAHTVEKAFAIQIDGGVVMGHCSWNQCQRKGRRSEWSRSSAGAARWHRSFARSTSGR